MPRGSYDYFTPTSGISAQQIDGSALLAGLGGVQPVDGKGRLYFYDTFAKGLKRWELIRSGTGSYPKLSDFLVFAPPVSVQFSPNTELGNGSAMMRMGFIFTGNNDLGMEFAINQEAQANIFSGIMTVSDGTRNYQAELRINPETRGLDLNTSTGYVEVMPLPLNVGTPAWLQFKFVIDTGTHSYKRVIVGNKSIDVDYLIKDVGAATAGDYHLLMTFYCTGLAGSEDSTRLGYVILTTDEP